MKKTIESILYILKERYKNYLFISLIWIIGFIFIFLNYKNNVKNNIECLYFSIVYLEMGVSLSIYPTKLIKYNKVDAICNVGKIGKEKYLLQRIRKRIITILVPFIMVCVFGYVNNYIKLFDIAYIFILKATCICISIYFSLSDDKRPGFKEIRNSILMIIIALLSVTCVKFEEKGIIKYSKTTLGSILGVTSILLIWMFFLIVKWKKIYVNKNEYCE